MELGGGGRGPCGHLAARIGRPSKEQTPQRAQKLLIDGGHLFRAVEDGGGTGGDRGAALVPGLASSCAGQP